jgi:hypothetical protein
MWRIISHCEAFCLVVNPRKLVQNRSGYREIHTSTLRGGSNFFIKGKVESGGMGGGHRDSLRNISPKAAANSIVMLDQSVIGYHVARMGLESVTGPRSS